MAADPLNFETCLPWYCYCLTPKNALHEQYSLVVWKKGLLHKLGCHRVQAVQLDSWAAKLLETLPFSLAS